MPCLSVHVLLSVSMCEMLYVGSNGEAYFQLVDGLRSLFSSDDSSDKSVSPKMRLRSYSVGSSPHSPCSPRASRLLEPPAQYSPCASLRRVPSVEDKAPPPLPLKQSRSGTNIVVCHRQETEPIPVRSPRQAYVQLDLSDPSRIIISDLTAVETPRSMSPTKRDQYIVIDPNNPTHMLDLVEETSEDGQTEMAAEVGRSPLLSNDTFYSAFSTMDDSFYNPAVSPLEFEGTESIYEIPIELLLRQKQLEQQAEQQKRLEVGSDAPPIPERASTRLEKYRMESLATSHRQSRSPPPLPRHRHPSWVCSVLS